MNILIIGTGEKEQLLTKLCLKSKLLDRIYTASNEPLDDIPNIEYSDYNDLCYKAKALQIDIALVFDINHIKNDILNIFQKNKLNIICSDAKWINLETSRIIAKQLVNYYSINTPQILKVPISFPIVLKTNNLKTKKIAYSMQELIKYREQIENENVYLEEYLNGEEYSLISMWDGKSLFHFEPNFSMTEVQADRLELYKTKLTFMLSDEKASFKGFLVSKLLWARNDWHVLSYRMSPSQKELEEIFNSSTKDFLYILNSIIYQRLDEI